MITPSPVSSPPDSCPECVTTTVRPYLNEPDGETGLRSYYRCGSCGHRWWTSRLLSYEEMAELGTAGAA